MIDWQRFAKPLTAVVLTGSLVASLSGCVGVIVGGAVVGGFAATDRRTLGDQTADKEIAFKANSKLPSLVGDTGHVDITTYNRKVLLTGEVKDDQTKQNVEQEMRNIPDVLGVMNELQVGFTSSISSRTNDLYITSKVSATFVDAKELNANSIKVVTERGNVYLLGRVTQREGDLAANLVAGISGVKSVVKMFEYITDDELRQMNSAQGARG
jgi:osmotically-inducible protein OsmY